MNKLGQKLTIVFAAGCLGGLVNSLVLWLFANARVLSQLGVRIAPGDMPGWLYPRIVWGGIWGFLFLLPVLKAKPVFQALLFSLGPTVVQLFVVFPQAGNGTLGLKLGSLTPLAVIFFNIVWAVTTVVWIRFAGGGDKKKS